MARLTNEAYNALNRLATVSKMDCWFMLRTNKVGDDVIYDLEGRRTISLTNGIGQMIDGMTELDYSRLTDAERRAIIVMPATISHRINRRQLTAEQVEALTRWCSNEPNKWIIKETSISFNGFCIGSTSKGEPAMSDGVRIVLALANPTNLPDSTGFTLVKLITEYFRW